tara:strand:- start:34559 stop:36493 length:1935 start_codon:yes stop_codon:yes gene_type:complete
MRFASTILLIATFILPSYGWKAAIAQQPAETVTGGDAPGLDAANKAETNPSLAEVDQWIAAGQFVKAADRLRFLDDQAGSIDLTHRLAQVARGLQQAEEQDLAVDFYLRSVASAGSDRAASMDPRARALVHLAAASALVQADKKAEAVDCLLPLLSERFDTAPPQVAMAVRLCLHVGSDSLRQGKLALAERAYRIAVDHADASQREKALLGAAWTEATAGEHPESAAKKLLHFVQEFPDNTDGHRALRLAATCLRQAGKTDESTKTLGRLLTQFPQSQSADEIVRTYLYFPINDIPGPVLQWVLSQGSEPKLQALDAAMCGLGIRVAANASDADALDAFAQQLARTDQTGQPAADVLQQLVHGNRMAEAQRTAAGWIASEDADEVSLAVREASCRWAGRHELWSMLALASESVDPQTDSQSRSANIERLFAEALMQTGQAAAAHPWWKQVVDVRGADDFATLLRCAETATSHADPEEATRRIAAARESIGDDARRRSLVEMLTAELQIRRLKFDEARSTLEGMIRDPESIRQLRGRAQWLIGETHYLQQKYPEAINAYRKVEGIDPDGPWVPVALVQAGKSFEQLGRTREASVCYSTLISRFADNPHAQAARTRMAALTPQANTPADSNRTNDHPSQNSIKLRR